MECKHDKVILLRSSNKLTCASCHETVTPVKPVERKLHLVSYEEYIDDYGCDETRHLTVAFYLNGPIGNFSEWLQANSKTFAARWPGMDTGGKADLYASFLQSTGHERVDTVELFPDYGDIDEIVDRLKEEHIERLERAKLAELKAKYPE